MDSALDKDNVIKGMKFQNWFIPDEGAQIAWAVFQSNHPRTLSWELSMWLESFHRGRPQKMDGKDHILNERYGIVGTEDREFEYEGIKTYEIRMLLLMKGSRMFDKVRKYWAKMGDYGVPVYEKDWMNFV